MARAWRGHGAGMARAWRGNGAGMAPPQHERHMRPATAGTSESSLVRSGLPLLRLHEHVARELCDVGVVH